MPKNKKQKENAKFYETFFGKTPSRSRDDEDSDDEKEDDSIVNLPDPDGRMILYVDTDIDFHEYNSSVLAPPRGKRSKGADEERVHEWFQEREKKKFGAKIEKLQRNEFVHARSHSAVDKAAENFAQLSERTNRLMISLDTEGIEPKIPLPAMVQLAASVNGKERCVVF